MIQLMTKNLTNVQYLRKLTLFILLSDSLTDRLLSVKTAAQSDNKITY